MPAAARTQRQHAALVAPVRPPAGGLNNAPSDATLSAVSTARAARETVLRNQAAAPQNQTTAFRNQAAVQYSTPARGQTAAFTAPPMPLRPHEGGGGGDGDSDWGGSDAEAYIDFQRTAKTFRTWRSHAFAIKESRWETHMAHTHSQQGLRSQVGESLTNTASKESWREPAYFMWPIG